MAAHKDFDAALAEASDQPITFTLGGEVFKVRRMSAKRYLRYCRDIAAATVGEGDIISATLIEDCIEPDQRERWNEVLDAVSVEAVPQVLNYIMESSVGRPIGTPSTLASESSGFGASSNGVSPVPQPTPST